MTGEEQFLDKEKFTSMVNSVVQETNVSYMDAVIAVCDVIEMDLRDVKPFMSSIIKGKIKNEAVCLNYMKSDVNRLPI
jgi:hypothetical protein